MPATKGLDSWLEKPATGKRKRAAAADYADSGDASDKENIGRKKAQPAKKRQAKAFNAAKTPDAAKKSTTANPKKGSDAKEAKELYTETLKAIDKRVDELDKKVKTMSGNSSSITTAATRLQLANT